MSLFSCGEMEVDTIDYAREMRNYINNSLDGRELYSTDIYPEEISFAIDESGDLYLYRVDNVVRVISIDSLDLYEPEKYIYPFNYIRDAVAVVDDEFTGYLRRIRGEDTTLAYKFESSLQRFAYFFKMYDDNYQYHGWRFWAYSCLNYSIDGCFKSYDSSLTFCAIATAPSSLPNYRLGRYYVQEDDIPKLPLGDSISFWSDYPERLFVRNNSEDLMGINTNLIDGKYRTGWRIPQATNVFYNIITFDSNESGYYFKVDTVSVAGESLVVESTFVKRGDYIIPYKVDI